VSELREKVEAELLSGILPFWLNRTIDEEHGGFRGQIANDLTVDPHAAKGLILNAASCGHFQKPSAVYKIPHILPPHAARMNISANISGTTNSAASIGWSTFKADPQTPKSASTGRHLPSTRWPSMHMPQASPSRLTAP
jgi:hypothetical protein